MNATTDNPTDAVTFDAFKLNGRIHNLFCYGGPFNAPFGPHVYSGHGGNCQTAAPRSPNLEVSHAEAAAFFRDLPTPLTGPAVEWLADRNAVKAASAV